MGNFYTDVIQKDPRFMSVNAVVDLGLLEPVTRAAVQAIIVAATQLGHRLVPVETYRSTQRQAFLFQKRVTQLKTVGVHHYGCACDLAREDGGVYDPRGEDYLFLRTLAEEHGLISGVDWGEPAKQHSFRDWDHVQRVAVSRQDSLFDGRWYPDEGYRPLTDLGDRAPTPFNAPLVT